MDDGRVLLFHLVNSGEPHTLVVCTCGVGVRLCLHMDCFVWNSIRDPLSLGFVFEMDELCVRCVTI